MDGVPKFDGFGLVCYTFANSLSMLYDVFSGRGELVLRVNDQDYSGRPGHCVIEASENYFNKRNMYRALLYIVQTAEKLESVKF